MWFTHISTSTAAIKWCHYTRLSKHCDFNTAHLRMLPLSCCASLHLHVSGEALSLCCLTELLSKQMRLLQTLRRLLCAELITGTSAASMATFVRLSFDHAVVLNMQHSSAHVAVARCMCLHAVLGGLSPTCMFIRVHFCPQGDYQ